MLPPDFSFVHAAAVLLVVLCWFTYGPLLSFLGHGSLNSRLELVRRQWVRAMTRRQAKPFDAVLIGHIIHSVAFFGSATLIVLAGVLTVLVSLENLHRTLSNLHFISKISMELFALQYGFLTLVLTVCFFSFTYALRKLIYAIALMGALPDASEDKPVDEQLVNHAAKVMSEALKTFNSGIRGYYYAVAALFMFVSPWACIAATLIATMTLITRQIATPTSRAVNEYVKAVELQEQEGNRN